jgi:hypothetical protein
MNIKNNKNKKRTKKEKDKKRSGKSDTNTLIDAKVCERHDCNKLPHQRKYGFSHMEKTNK